MLHGSVPSFVNALMVEGSDFVKVPAFERMDNGPGVASMDTTTLHGHFASLEVLCVFRQRKGWKIGVGAILGSELLERRDHKLVKGSTGWCHVLVLFVAKLANDPVLAIGAGFNLGGMHNELLGLGRGFIKDLLEAFGTGSEHGDLDAAFGQVQGNGTAELGGRSSDKDFLDVGWDLLEDGSGSQGIPMDHASREVGIVVDKEFAATIESFVLVEGTQSDNSDTGSIGFEDGFFDLAIDKVPLALEEELDGPGGRAPGLHLEAAKTVLVRNEDLAKDPHDGHDENAQGPKGSKPPLGFEGS